MSKLLSLATLTLVLTAPAGAADERPARLRGALLTTETTTAARLGELRDQGYTAAVLMLDADSAAARKADLDAAGRVASAGLDLWYWIEIARCPRLADEHPRWMASLQGHQEWRRFFKDFPVPKSGEVVKNYPWVPILYRESFDAHLARVKELLAARPVAKGLLLNDLQGPPSACGCGNPVCRWTADYGPIKTAEPLGDDAAQHRGDTGIVGAPLHCCGREAGRQWRAGRSRLDHGVRRARRGQRCALRERRLLQRHLLEGDLPATPPSGRAIGNHRSLAPRAGRRARHETLPGASRLG